MATNTSKIGLQKDDPNDTYNVIVVNQNLDRLDAAIGLKVVTSTTRPTTARFPGMEIYETDTGRYLYWDGTAWQNTASSMRVVTSTTRPSNPYTGLEIFETDTARTLVWDGDSWEITNYIAPALGVVNLGTTAAAVSTNVAQGRTFRAAITANVALNAPSNPVDGEVVTWEITASGAARTITPVTTAGGFRFGSTITSWSQIASGLTDVMRAKYHQPSNLWRVLDIMKGF